MSRLRDFLDRFVRGLRYYVGNVAQRFFTEDVFLWNGAIAFKVLVTFLPLTFLSVGIFSRFVGREQVFSGIVDTVKALFPSSQSEDVIEAVLAFAEASDTVIGIGSVALLVVVVTLFSTLRNVLENIFRYRDDHEGRGFLWGYLIDLRLAFVSSLLFLSSIGLTVGVRMVRRWGLGVIAEYGQQGGLFFARLWITLGTYGSYLIPLLVTFLLFFSMYYLTPKPRPAIRSALVGAGVTAFFWEIAKNAFTLYAQYVGRFDRYGDMLTEGEGAAALGQVFGLVLALVFWVYYSSLVFIIGGMVVVLHQSARQAEEAESTLPAVAPEDEAGDVERTLGGEYVRSAAVEE
ncbi:MAG: YihY/virulence factor BrkB family protein [Bacteroidota bacterium]